MLTFADGKVTCVSVIKQNEILQLNVLNLFIILENILFFQVCVSRTLLDVLQHIGQEEYEMCVVVYSVNVAGSVHTDTFQSRSNRSHWV